MEVVIRQNYDDMSKVAAQMVAELLNTKPNGVLGMATGSTPLGLYQELVRMHQQGKIDFSRVMTFNLDEYVGLPGNHPQSYAYFMQENFFQHVNVQPQNINVPSGTTSNYPAFCDWYEKRIIESGGIDLQILGIGSDDHIAFNFFFSSRRRHTRFDCDWSSDVCSSDLRQQWNRKSTFFAGTNCSCIEEKKPRAIANSSS